MTPERHALIKEVFLAAMSSPPDERSVVLERRCGDDQDLQREVERLIAHHTDETITPDSPTVNSPMDDWRRAGPQLDLDANETRAQPRPATSRSGVSVDHDRSPGTVVAGRYRIVSLLGRGGMGVVYRAEDLTLGQTVALKFLIPAMAASSAWLARFRNEARLARKVTHPCVCRMYDIGEADGEHFLTMEYVDGEDLDSLITRIGRLPREKAVDVARQICIGLAAAHGAGVLHRDLKPANIMLDGRGQVRITDFGLAALPEEIKDGEIRAGTPAFMAPEQIAGREVTAQSDIYSLGLVLYVVFAGKPAFQAKTSKEYEELHLKSRPVPLSDVVEDLPPDVERIVARCLEKNARDRPGSALEVAAALPGGNLLAMALAANLTPTPEMVAAATPKASGTPAPGKLLAVSLVLLAALIAVRGLAPASWISLGTRPPAVLAEQARELIKAAGHSGEASYGAYGFCPASVATLMSYGYRLPETKSHLAVNPEDELVFWYRQCSEKFAPSAVHNVMLGAARVTPTDPPLGTPGMVSVVSDLSGRLLLFATTPGHGSFVDESTSAREGDRWAALFQRALLDPAAMVAEEPRVDSLFQADQPLAWQSPDPDGSELIFHVEALARNGRPMFFAVSQSTEDWAAAHHPESVAARETVTTTSLRIVFLVIAFVAIPLAWVNYRGGRSDRVGAMRLAILVVVIQLAGWMLRATHTSDFSTELLNIVLASLQAVGMAAFLCVFYVALEPVARRYWPDMLITWSRALSFRWRDPNLGHHVMVGVCVGCFWALMVASERGFVNWLDWDVRHSLFAEKVAANLLGGRVALAGYLGAMVYALFRGLLFLLLLAVLRALVRRPLLAAVLAGLIIAPMVVPRGAHELTSWFALGLCGVAVGVWVMIRYGLVTLTVAIYVAYVLNTSPITWDFNAWYADQSLIVLAMIVALVTYGFFAARPEPSAR